MFHVNFKAHPNKGFPLTTHDVAIRQLFVNDCNKKHSKHLVLQLKNSTGVSQLASACIAMTTETEPDVAAVEDGARPRSGRTKENLRRNKLATGRLFFKFIF